MKNSFLILPCISLLIVSTLVTSCNGQEKTNVPQETVANQFSFTGIVPKLAKTQGSDVAQNVYFGIQDKAGNLWFATTGEGVFRYDGKSFTRFTEKDGLSNNRVWAILEDKSGIIYFGTDNGISLFDGKKITAFPLEIIDSKNHFPLISPKNPNSKNAVWSMMQDKNGIIWMGTDDGVYCYDGKSLTRFLDNPLIVNKSKLTLKSVQSMYEDKEGNMWFGSGPMMFEGICFYNGKTLTNYKPKNEGWIRKITVDKNGALLFATRHNGVITFDGKNFSDYAQPVQLQKDLLNTIFVDSKGNTWYGSDYTNDYDMTTGGVWKFDGKSFIQFTKDVELTYTSAFSFTEDKAGNIWIGTRNTGLFRYDGKTFTRFSD